MIIKTGNHKAINNYNFDKADLVQTIIIIAGFAVAAIVAIGGITSVAMDKGKTVAECASSFSAVNSNSKSDCETVDRGWVKISSDSSFDNYAYKYHFIYSQEERANDLELRNKETIRSNEISAKQKTYCETEMNGTFNYGIVDYKIDKSRTVFCNVSK